MSTGRDGTNRPERSELTFNFEGVFNPGRQDDVYESVAREPVETLFEGYSATILAYGQTGAGKSYTMYGHPHRHNKMAAETGLVFRALTYILKRAAEIKALVKISFLEVYNDQLRDLLQYEQRDLVLQVDETKRKGCTERVVMIVRIPSLYVTEEMNDSQEDPRLGVVIKGLHTETVSSVDQALEYLASGERCRSTGEHSLNSTSSRSHAIFTIYLESKAGRMGSDAN